MTAKYPSIMILYAAKLEGTLPGVGQSVDIIKLGQHVKVMLEASAWLWRGVYEGLGLSGYSPSASAFFEAFGYALRSKGLVADVSIKDADGNVTLIAPALPRKQESTDTETAAPSNVVPLPEFLSKHYSMSVEVANEIYAASLLYNGYRAIERGQHIPGDDDQPTTYMVYQDLYTQCMSVWPDAKADEFVKDSVLAGVFRRAGQGTTGVSIDDDMSSSTAQMIYTFAQGLWAAPLSTVGTERPCVIFFNPTLNEIVTKSVRMYNELVSISKIGHEG